MKRLFAFDRCEEARRENGDAELDGQETVPQLYAQQRLTKVVKGRQMGIRQSGQNIAFPNPNGRLGPALRSLLKRCEASGTSVGSVSSRECLDAPAILDTFTAGRTGLLTV